MRNLSDPCQRDPSGGWVSRDAPEGVSPQKSAPKLQKAVFPGCPGSTGGTEEGIGGMFGSPYTSFHYWAGGNDSTVPLEPCLPPPPPSLFKHRHTRNSCYLVEPSSGSRAPWVVSQQSPERGVIVPISQTDMLRFREGRSVVQGHTAGARQSRDWTRPVCLQSSDLSSSYCIFFFANSLPSFPYSLPQIPFPIFPLGAVGLAETVPAGSREKFDR